MSYEKSCILCDVTLPVRKSDSYHPFRTVCSALYKLINRTLCVILDIYLSTERVGNRGSDLGRCFSGSVFRHGQKHVQKRHPDGGSNQ